MKESIFNARRFTSFQILYCILERSIRILNPTKLGRKRWNGSHLLKATETLTESVESRLNSSGTSSQDLTRCSSVTKSKVYCTDWVNATQFHRKNSTMSMFNDISCGTKDNEQECLAHARVVSLVARKFGTGHWLFIGPSSEKKWYSMKEDSPQGIWDKMAEKMLIEFAESGCPTFRATTPSSRSILISKGHGKLSIHFAATQETIETFSHNCHCLSAQSLRSSRKHVCGM